MSDDAYEIKSRPSHLSPNLAAFLKYEATPLTRVSIAAPKGTKMGSFVAYPLRDNKKLLALSDEVDGKVWVQPHNCVLALSQANLQDQEVAALKQEGDAYGIVYINVKG